MAKDLENPDSRRELTFRKGRAVPVDRDDEDDESDVEEVEED